MNYKIQIDGLEGQNIEVQPAGFFSGYKLFVNREIAPKGPKRGQMVLRKNDGTTTIAVWKPQMLGVDVPQLEVDGKTIKIVEPLAWYEYLWNGLPVLLIFHGGALGAVTGMIGFSINTKLFRSSRGIYSKYILSGVVSIMSVVLFLVAAMLFMSLIS